MKKPKSWYRVWRLAIDIFFANLVFCLVWYLYSGQLPTWQIIVGLILLSAAIAVNLAVGLKSGLSSAWIDTLFFGGVVIVCLILFNFVRHGGLRADDLKVAAVIGSVFSLIPGLFTSLVLGGTAIYRRFRKSRTARRVNT